MCPGFPTRMQMVNLVDTVLSLVEHLFASFAHYRMNSLAGRVTLEKTYSYTAGSEHCEGEYYLGLATRHTSYSLIENYYSRRLQTEAGMRY